MARNKPARPELLPVRSVTEVKVPPVAVTRLQAMAQAQAEIAGRMGALCDGLVIAAGGDMNRQWTYDPKRLILPALSESPVREPSLRLISQP